MAPPLNQRKPPKLLDLVRTACRLRHFSLSTEQTYTQWVRRYVLYHGKRHPEELGAQHIQDFLSYLAQKRHVAASTKNQALHALLFLYQHVLAIPVGDLGTFIRARRPKRLPVVFAREEIARLFSVLHGTPHLVAVQLYGSRLRLMEAIHLRVKDLNFAYQ